MTSEQVAGITSIGCYIPTTRIKRSAIANAVSWAIPSVKSMSSGERSVASWDEDAITMAVEAARECLGKLERDTVGSVVLASTTAPFADRSNSGIIADALSLENNVANFDVGGSRRAGTSALIQGFAAMSNEKTSLITVSECSDTKPGSQQEMSYGHGAVSLLLGHEKPLAVALATSSLQDDLVDHYRSADADYDYAFEERWVREEGYLTLVPEAVSAVFDDVEISPSDVDYFILPASMTDAKRVAKKCSLDKAEIVDPLEENPGHCGTAAPFLMLADVLERSKPGQLILLTGFGQGVDAILLETTGNVDKDSKLGISRQLSGGQSDDNYVRFLSMRQQLQLDFGMRSERDNRTAVSTFYRKRKAITGFVGGRCSSCNTLQFPKTQVCVECSEVDSQVEESFAELKGNIKSFTEDWQAYTPGPPLTYGNITFPDGGNVMMEFADFTPGQAKVGMEVRMAFRIKDLDPNRHFRRYFWKACALKGDS